MKSIFLHSDPSAPQHRVYQSDDMDLFSPSAERHPSQRRSHTEFAAHMHTASPSFTPTKFRSAYAPLALSSLIPAYVIFLRVQSSSQITLSPSTSSGLYSCSSCETDRFGGTSGAG